MSNVIWVDNNDNVLGEITREKAHKEGLLHRVAVIYVVNDKNEILVNERAKDGYLDHSSAGHIDIGESYPEAAKRELEEELGISGVKLQEIGSSQSQDKGDIFDSRHMFKIFICKSAPKKLKEDEVKNVFWANPNEVYKDMSIHPEKYTGGFKSTLRVFLEYYKIKS